MEEAGALVTAALAAAEIDAASVRRRDAARPPQHCSNCHAQLIGAYCHACGQAAHLHRSLLHLTEEVLHGVLHFDAKGWRTLPLLIARPGVLTRRYIDGQRTRYVSPLALFLFSIFLMFFVYSMLGGGVPSTPISAAQRAAAKAELAQTVAESEAEVARATAALARARSSGADVADAEAGLAEAKADQRITEMTAHTVDSTLAIASSASAGGGTPAGGATHASTDSWQSHVAALDVRTGSAVLDAKIHRALSDPDFFLYKLKNTAYKFSFMLVPISLPFLWLMFIGRPEFAVYDHAVFALYSLSFMSLLFITAALMVAIGSGSWVVFPVTAIPPLHMFLQLRETYGLTVVAALWRTVTLLCVAGSAFLLFLLFIVMVSLH